MFWLLTQVAALVFSHVHLTHQIGFSFQESNRSESSPERVQKHEKYLNTFQNAQKDCAEEVVGNSSTDAMIDYIIAMDKNLKGNVSDAPTKNFFGCLCKEFDLVNKDGTVRTEALEEFFDGAADEDYEVPLINNSCGGRFANLKTNHYLESCLEIYRCLEEFDDDED